MRSGHINANTRMRLRRIVYAVMVSRWARTRVSAWNRALDLFVENGYEETTSRRSRIGRFEPATFFRHFADKRRFCSAVKTCWPGCSATPSGGLAGGDASECLHAALVAAGPR